MLSIYNNVSVFDYGYFGANVIMQKKCIFNFVAGDSFDVKIMFGATLFYI